MKLSRIALILGALFLALGAGLFFYVNKTNPIINKTFPTKAYEVQAVDSKVSGNPTELLIPSLNMDLTVVPGHYNPNTGTWNLSLSEVQYAVTTPAPNNEEGATFLYGHYRPEVFAYLHLIKAASMAEVKTDNNHTFYYQLASIRTTVPTDDSVFKYHGPPELVVQTCTGAFFQYRQFYTFNLVKVA